MNWTVVLEIFYSFVGFLMLSSGVFVFLDKKNKTRIGGTLFWFILGLIFIVGKYVPSEIVGIAIVVLGLLSAFKQVNLAHLETASEHFRTLSAKKLGNKIFIPSLVLAISAFLIAQFLPKIMPKEQASTGGQIAIGFSAVIGLLLVLLITRSKAKNILVDSTRVIQQMGPAAILPQLLATLGVVFTTAGVGALISALLANVIPENNRFIGVMMYCIGMVVFTIIMGNGFAAFSVITVGIGVPFVLANGANPAIAGAIALTCGYCGTLLTPMAANFNIIPVNLLETKSPYTVIKYQAPTALILLVVQILMMYFWAY